MKALTVCQPFAHLIATGEKRVENRVWQTSYRGSLAIHAGKSRDWLRGAQPTPDMAFGAVVCIVDLVDCVPIEGIARGIYDRKHPWLRYHYHTEGPFCWVLSRIRAINPPADCFGRQRLWGWQPPADLAAQLKCEGRWI